MSSKHTDMADYTLKVVAESGYESETEGRCSAEQYGAAMAVLHGNRTALEKQLLEAAQAAWNCIAELSPTQARVEVVQMLQEALAAAGGAQQ